MSLVTIDDRITRLKEHSVSIEIVERVDRTCFYTAGSNVPLEHEDENILWVRGQHLLDSDEVKAARSAVALGEKGYGPIGHPGVTGPMGVTGPIGLPGLYIGDVPGDLGQTTTDPPPKPWITKKMLGSV